MNDYPRYYTTKDPSWKNSLRVVRADNSHDKVWWLDNDMRAIRPSEMHKESAFSNGIGGWFRFYPFRHLGFRGLANKWKRHLNQQQTVSQS
jgi:hypothetical protein